MDKSTHRVDIVTVRLEKHPNADALSLVKLFGGGYQVVVRTQDWKDGDFAAYIPPDTLVPLDRPEFAFLKDRPESPKLVNGREYHRLRAIRLRKEYSVGMLVQLPPDIPIHTKDLAKHFEVIHYEPEPKNSSKQTTYGSQAETPPTVKVPFYDIDSLRRHTDVFLAGEPVYITEKIHGANARYTAEDRGLFNISLGRYFSSVRFGSRLLTWGKGRGFRARQLPEYARYMRCGSRSQWKRPDPNDIWWRALTPEMAKFCQNHPGKVLFGEVYGDVQDLDYGLKPGEVKFIAFDIWDSEERRYLSVGEFLGLTKRYGIATVPQLAINAPFDLEKVLATAEGKSALQLKHIAERAAELFQNNESVGPIASREVIKQRLKYVEGQPLHVREGVVVRPMVERNDLKVGRVLLKAVGNGYLERAA